MKQQSALATMRAVKAEIAEPSCGGCLYFQPPSASSASEKYGLTNRPGRCRRYPEAHQKERFEWCGEFVPQPAAE
ncbi:MAG TPA: hypothetical protein VGG27_06735 [Magnetospirillaceae bacterium]